MDQEPSSPPHSQTSGSSPNNPPSKEARTWALVAHLSPLAGYVIPFAGSVIAPLVVWLIKKDEMPFVDDQGKEALNFQITMLLVNIVGLLLIFVVIGFFIIAAAVVANLVLIIIAAIRANEGVAYRYPFALRLVH